MMQKQRIGVATLGVLVFIAALFVDRLLTAPTPPAEQERRDGLTTSVAAGLGDGAAGPQSAATDFERVAAGDILVVCDQQERPLPQASVMLDCTRRLVEFPSDGWVACDLRGEVPLSPGCSTILVAAPGYVPATYPLKSLRVFGGKRYIELKLGAALRIAARDLMGNPVRDGVLAVSSCGGYTPAKSDFGMSVPIAGKEGGGCVMWSRVVDGAVEFNMLAPGRYGLEMVGDLEVCLSPVRPIDVLPGSHQDVEVVLGAVMVAAVTFGPDVPSRVQQRPSEHFKTGLGGTAVSRALSSFAERAPGATVLAGVSVVVPPPPSIEVQLRMGQEKAEVTCLFVPVKNFSSIQAIEYRQPSAIAGMERVRLIAHDRNGKMLKDLDGFVREIKQLPEVGKAIACSSWTPLFLPPGKYEAHLGGLGMAAGRLEFDVYRGVGKDVAVNVPVVAVEASVSAQYPDGRIPPGFSLAIEAGDIRFSVHSTEAGAVPVTLPEGPVRLHARVGSGKETITDVVVTTANQELCKIALPLEAN